MFSSARSTVPSATTMCSAPSPSTRASELTRSCLLRWLISVPLHEAGCGGGEGREYPVDIGGGHAVDTQDGKQRTDIRLLHRPETAEAAAPVGGAQCAAPGLGDRAQARDAVGDGDTGGAAALALGAHAGVRQVGCAAGQECAERVEQLAAVDRAAAQLEV